MGGKPRTTRVQLDAASASLLSRHRQRKWATLVLAANDWSPPNHRADVARRIANYVRHALTDYDRNLRDYRDEGAIRALDAAICYVRTLAQESEAADALVISEHVCKVLSEKKRGLQRRSVFGLQGT